MAGKVQRSKPTRSRPARPSQKRYPQTRLETMVLVGVGAVLLIAATIVLAGLFITQYLPPRAHVLTVDGQEYTANDLKKRGSYMLLNEQEYSADVTQDILIERVVNRITRDRVVLLRAPALVGEATDEDVAQDLRVQLGFADPSPTPAPSPAAGATIAPTSTAAATPTEVITPDPEEQARIDEDFGAARQDLYRASGLGRDEFDDIRKVKLLEERLSAKFEAELAPTAPQIHLQVIRVADEATAQRVRDQALAGSDFVRLASQYSVTATAKQDGGELGWTLIEALPPETKAVVENLATGAISAIIPRERFFELYRVADATTSRELEPDQVTRLVGDRVTAWYDAERATVTVEEDISDDERSWMLDEIVQDAVTRGAAQRPATATPTTSAP